MGLFYRGKAKKRGEPINFSDFKKVINNGEERRLVSVFKHIRGIDKDNNGYATGQELEDIFRLEYGSEFEGKELKPIFKQFASVLNPILVDYKLLRTSL